MVCDFQVERGTGRQLACWDGKIATGRFKSPSHHHVEGWHDLSGRSLTLAQGPSLLKEGALQTWMRRESDLVQALAQAYAEREVLEASIRAAAEVTHPLCPLPLCTLPLRKASKVALLFLGGRKASDPPIMKFLIEYPAIAKGFESSIALLWWQKGI